MAAMKVRGGQMVPANANQEEMKRIIRDIELASPMLKRMRDEARKIQSNPDAKRVIEAVTTLEEIQFRIG